MAANTAQAVTLFSGDTAALPALGVERELKVVRIVGAVNVYAAANVAANVPVGIGLLKYSTFTNPVVGGFADPLVADELGQEDWMRMLNTDVPPNAFNNAWKERHELDVRVRRNLKSNEAIRLVATRAADGVAIDVIITIDVRILIVIKL